jgi:hypothetical protein
MDFPMTPGDAAGSVPKRRETRLPATLEVRIFGIDANGKAFHQPATTLDISVSGTRVTGLTVPLNKGDIVGLQSSGAKSRFRVSWVRDNQNGTFLVGLQCKEKGGCPWRESMLQKNESSPRGEERIPCQGTATLRSALIPTPICGTLRDINSRGCYVHCANVAPEGDVLSGQFLINGVHINGVAEVRYSVPAFGMGLLWCDLGYDGQEKLKGVIRTLTHYNFDPASGQEKAQLQVNQLHQLVATLRERLANDHAPVNAETIKRLRDAQEGITSALESLQA